MAVHVIMGTRRATAVIAGVLGAKKTSELIPFCHPLPLNNVGIATAWQRGSEVCS